MRTRGKLQLLIAAAVVSTSLGMPSGAQQLVPTQVVMELNSLLASGDLEAIYAFLMANPSILSVPTPLTRELQVFVAAVQSGNITQARTAIASVRSPSPGTTTLASVSPTVSSIY